MRGDPADRLALYVFLVSQQVFGNGIQGGLIDIERRSIDCRVAAGINEGECDDNAN